MIFGSHSAEETNHMVLTSVINALCNLKGAWTSALQTLALSQASEVDTSLVNVARLHILRSCPSAQATEFQLPYLFRH